MLRDLWTAGSLVPYSHGSKVPFDPVFASRVITKKCAVSIFNLLQFQNFPWAYHICKKTFRNKLSVIFKKQKNKAPQFYFFPPKLGHKNLFNRYKSSETHMGEKKAISASLPKPQQHTFTRWLETAYGHWAHPGQRSHISPIIYNNAFSYKTFSQCL